MATRAPAKTERSSARPQQRSGLALRVAVALIGGCGGAESTAPATATTPEPARPERIAMSLRFEDGGVDAQTDTPHTRVVVALIHESDGRTEEHAAGTIDGACNYVAPTGNALSAGSCWWAGSGANYDVVRDGDVLVVRRIVVDEDRAEPLPMETVLRVSLPARAQLQVIAPETMH
jgi:hypothetical protein